MSIFCVFSTMFFLLQGREALRDQGQPREEQGVREEDVRGAKRWPPRRRGRSGSARRRYDDFPHHSVAT